MKRSLEKYQRTIYLAIILIALGVTFSTTMPVKSLGTVFIAVGGLFFIIGMSQKRKASE